MPLKKSMLADRTGFDQVISTMEALRVSNLKESEESSRIDFVLTDDRYLIEPLGVFSGFEKKHDPYMRLANEGSINSRLCRGLTMISMNDSHDTILALSIGEGDITFPDVPEGAWATYVIDANAIHNALTPPKPFAIGKSGDEIIGLLTLIPHESLGRSRTREKGYYKILELKDSSGLNALKFSESKEKPNDAEPSLRRILKNMTAGLDSIPAQTGTAVLNSNRFLTLFTKLDADAFSITMGREFITVGEKGGKPVKMHLKGILNKKGDPTYTGEETSHFKWDDTLEKIIEFVKKMEPSRITLKFLTRAGDSACLYEILYGGNSALYYVKAPYFEVEE